MAKNITELNESNFDDFIGNGGSVIDFWAQWCGPCKMMAPEFERAAEEMGGKVKFGKVDVDKESDLAQRFSVMSIPTMIFFRDGKPVDMTVGAMDRRDILDRVKRNF